MSALVVERVNTSRTGDETSSLSDLEIEDIGSAANKSSAPVTSVEIARQIRAATNPLTEKLERLCDLKKEL